MAIIFLLKITTKHANNHPHPHTTEYYIGLCVLWCGKSLLIESNFIDLQLDATYYDIHKHRVP